MAQARMRTSATGSAPAIQMSAEDSDSVMLVSSEEEESKSVKLASSAEDSKKNSAGDSKVNSGSSYRKRYCFYKSSVRYLSKMKDMDPTTLSARDKALIGKHRRAIASFENFKKAMNKAPTVQTTVPAGRASPTTASIRSPQSRNPPLRVRRLVSTIRNHRLGQRYAAAARSSTSSEAETPRRSVDDDTPEHLQVAIVDLSDPCGKITDERWLLVEEKILLALAEVPGKSDTPVRIAFHGAGWHKGVKVVNCDNEASLEFLSKTISELEELWRGAHLKVIPRSATLRPKSWMWIPPPDMSDESILKIMETQNPDLPVKNWQILRSLESSKGFGRDYQVLLDEQSLQSLSGSSLSVKFGLGTVKVRLEAKEKKPQVAVSDAN